MKTKVKSLFKAVIITALAVAAFYAAYRLADHFANRRLGDWFESQFMFVFYYSQPSPHRELFFRWETFKNFVLGAGMAAVAVYVISILVTVYICGRKCQKKLAAQKAEYDALMLRKEQAIQFETTQKNDLIAYLAHDLKTPMTSVIGYLSLLEEAPEMPEAQKAKCVHIALDKAFRLEGLINEFFEITRYNLHEVVLNKRPIDLGYMLSQMADEFYPVLQKNGNTVHLDVEDDLNIAVDAEKLARVFNNILKNAIAYSYDGTSIEITAGRAGERVRVTFCNEGNTIPKQKLACIFDKFYRLDESRGTNSGGAGLGLAIAKEIVTAHNGTITAESEDGKTTFTVELPC